MNEIFTVILSMSLSGGIMIVMLSLISLLFSKKLCRQWQYYIWLAAILRLLLPFAPQQNLMNTLFQSVKLSNQQISTKDADTHLTDQQASINDAANHLTDQQSPTNDAANHLTDQQSPTNDAANRLTDQQSPTNDAANRLTDQQSPTNDAATHLSDQQASSENINAPENQSTNREIG